VLRSRLRLITNSPQGVEISLLLILGRKYIYIYGLEDVANAHKRCMVSILSSEKYLLKLSVGLIYMETK
jgi:hypothetical protein